MAPPYVRCCWARAQEYMFVRVVWLIAGLCVAVLLVWHVGFLVVVEMLIRVGWRFPIVAGIYFLHVAVRAAALRRVLFTSTISYSDVLRIRLSTEAVEALTFTGPFLAEPAKGWLLTRRGVPTSAAFAAVITEYLLYTLASCFVAIPAITLLLTRHALPTAVRPAAAIVLLAVVAFVGAFAWASMTGIGLIVPGLRAIRVVIGARAIVAADRFVDVECQIIEFLHRRRRQLAAVMSIEAAAQALLVIEIWVVMFALGFRPSWSASLTIEGGVKFVGVAFAFVPGQFGASETVYALLAGALGFSTAAGVGLALVRRLRTLPVAILGLIVGSADPT